MDSNATSNATEISLENYLCDIHKNPVINIICNALKETQNTYPELTKDGLYICSGILFQTIWNMNLGKHLMYGISDIDIIWFDPNHTSYHEEDTVIKAIETFTKPYLNDIKIDAKNQARVHLWAKEKYGITKEPYHNIQQVIESTTSYVQSVAIRIDKNGKESVYAPYGIKDIYDMTVRENIKTEHPHSFFTKKATRWKQLWPEITVIDTTPSHTG